MSELDVGGCGSCGCVCASWQDGKGGFSVAGGMEKVFGGAGEIREGSSID